LGVCSGSAAAAGPLLRCRPPTSTRRHIIPANPRQIHADVEALPMPAVPSLA